MERLLRLLPDSASPHKPRSVDPSKIASVSLAAMANPAKPLRGVTPSRRSKVPGGGRSWFTNRALAHVRTPGGPTSPTQQLFRVARSSPNLCTRPSLTRSNRRGTGPVCPVVWEGWRREASPYPDLGRTPAVRSQPLEVWSLPKSRPTHKCSARFYTPGDFGASRGIRIRTSAHRSKRMRIEGPSCSRTEALER